MNEKAAYVVIVEGQVVGTFEVDIIAEVSSWVCAQLHLKLLREHSQKLIYIYLGMKGVL